MSRGNCRRCAGTGLIGDAVCRACNVDVYAPGDLLVGLGQRLVDTLTGSSHRPTAHGVRTTRMGRETVSLADTPTGGPLRAPACDRCKKIGRPLQLTRKGQRCKICR
ncbi:hypothetical protein [Candidatus Frankia alpina]|uniref:hypothetical protein n=1 Tax=Candidatus Frankia alpina TaxID=2699483 RepID=UPI0013D0B5A2|nr:hypothetical protein [Candidatus Frankia alpina]